MEYFCLKNFDLEKKEEEKKNKANNYKLLI